MKDRLIILVFFTAVALSLPFLGGGGKIIGEAVVFPESIRLLLTEAEEVVTLTAEEYIEGCISAQIPIDYEQEALNAQASAAATYALRLISDFRDNSTVSFTGKNGERADLSDSTALCQPYFSYEECKEQYGEDYGLYYPNIKKAAIYGLSHIITYENEPIYSVYHSVSTGETCNPEIVWGRSLPYLKPVKSEWDKGYINYECVNEMTTEKARALLVAYKSDIEIPADFGKWFSEFNVNESGYVISVKIGKTTFSGGDVWRIFGLRSPAFTISYSDNIFTFTTKGYGHGAGLSQYGANEMAKSGKTAKEILEYYYSGVNI